MKPALLKSLSISIVFLILNGCSYSLHLLTPAQTSSSVSIDCSKSASSLYAGGDGSSGNPYLISTPAQLDAIRCNLGDPSLAQAQNPYFKLTQDIDLTGYSLLPLTPDFDKNYINNLTLFGGTNATDPTKQFAATLDGNTAGHSGAGYAIKNWTITSSSYSNLALFPVVIGGTIQNLTIQSPSVTNTIAVNPNLPGPSLGAAALAGFSVNNTYTNISLIGNVKINNASSLGGHACGLIDGSGVDNFNNITLSLNSGSIIQVSIGGNTGGGGDDQVAGVVCNSGGIAPSSFSTVSVTMVGTTLSVGTASTQSDIGGVSSRAFNGPTYSNVVVQLTGATVFQSLNPAALTSIGGMFGNFGSSSDGGAGNETTITGTNSVTLGLSGADSVQFLGGAGTSLLGGFTGNVVGPADDEIENVTVNLAASTIIHAPASAIGTLAGSTSGSAITISGIVINNSGATLTGTSVDTVMANGIACVGN